MIMQTDKNQRYLGFISPRRKQLEEQYRRMFEREDVAIDRLANHAEQVKYLSNKFEGKQRSLNDLQGQLAHFREQNEKLHRDHLASLKKYDAAKLRVQSLEARIEELEEVVIDRNNLEMDNMQLKIELKRFQENLKEVAEKYEGEWLRTKQSEIQKEVSKNEILTENCTRLEYQLDKWKERLEDSQRENMLRLKQYEQTEQDLRKQLKDANERTDNLQQASQKLKRTLDQLRQQASKQSTMKRSLLQQIAQLKTKLQASEKYSEKIQIETKRQLQIKDQDFEELQNEHQRTLAEMSQLLAQLEITRRVQREIARVKASEYRQLSPISPKPLRTFPYPEQNNRRQSRMMGVGHISRVNLNSPIHSPQGRRFIEVLKRTRESSQLPSNEVRVVSKILQKAKYIT